MTSWGLGPIGVGFFIVFVFLVVGCFLDAIPAIIIVGTVLQPLADSVHMHPVSFAIISIVALAFGLVTPPYGLCLMISCADCQGPIAIRAQGHDDHAGADARRARGNDHLAADSAVASGTDPAGVPEVDGAFGGERIVA